MYDEKVDIEKYFSTIDLDIRKNHNGRWIDQKCTPDVLWSVADYISVYTKYNEEFTVRDIWDYEYTKQTISTTFSKPNTDDKSAENEYDKVFSQPINLLCNAGIISDISKTNRHLYIVKEKEILEYIAKNDNNSLMFIQIYIENVLLDSGLADIFYDFLKNPTPNNYNFLKERFVDYYHQYTPINGDKEPKRIFTKVLNPLAYLYKTKGTEKGKLSKNIIKKSDLMYNRDNFRDIYKDKPKEISRKDWYAMNKFDVRTGYFDHQLDKAKRVLREYNDRYYNGLSEYTHFYKYDGDIAAATQMHHIFPKNQFPEIRHLIENLIALTPNQHLTKAHPNNNTYVIDLNYQHELLIAKTNAIKENITNSKEIIYSFDNFKHVLAVGFDDLEAYELENNNFLDTMHFINYHYC